MENLHDSSDGEAEEEVPVELSLDALSQAYAEAMGASKGNKDSSEEEESADEQEQASESEEDSLAEEEEDDAETQVTPKGIVEAVLFVGHPENEPLTNRQIASLMRGVSPSEVDQIISAINEEYKKEGIPYYITSSGKGYCMTLQDAFAPLREKFYGKQREAKLSQAAVDVLAIVAYHQPVDRKQVDDIWGRESSRLLSQLVRRKLLFIERPEERPRQPFYKTTPRFLNLFGLDDLDGLPRSEINDPA